MSVTAPRGFRAAGVRAGLRAHGDRPDLALVVNDGPRQVARRGLHPQPGPGRAGAVVARCCPSGACGRSSSTPAAPTPAPARRVRRHPPHRREGRRGPGLRRHRGRGLLHRADRRAPADRGPARRGGRRGGRPGRRRRHRRRHGRAHHRHRRQAGRARSTPTAGRSAASAKGAGMMAPSLATMLVVVTTDADVDAADRRRRAARRDGRDLRPPRHRRLVSTNDTVLLLASGASGVTPGAGRVRRRGHRGVRRARPADAGRRRGRHQADRRHRRRAPATTPRPSSPAAPWPATAWSRPRCSAPTRTGAGSPRRSAPPRPRVDPQTLSMTVNGVLLCRPPPRSATAREADLSGPDVSVEVDLGLGAGQATVLDHRPVRTPTSTRTARTRRDAARPIPSRRADAPDRLHDAAAKAGVLAEALPWLQRFQGAVVVVKYGGNAMIDDALRRAFAEDMVFLRLAGIRPVVVHGGGPQITACSTGSASRRVPRRPARHHPRDDGRRPHGARRPGRPRARRADQRPRPVRGRPVR